MPSAQSAPSVLLLDDGELDHVHRLLKRLGLDYLRLKGREIGRFVEKPRDLILTSGKRTLDMPRLESMNEGSAEEAPEPTWVCLHNQDFLPMRERLRDLGVHFLVHVGLDEESLRLFLLQRLNSRGDRRSEVRLPLGDSVQWSGLDNPLVPGKLAELSSVSCRLLTTVPADPEAPVTIVLPASLGGSGELELLGHVIRCSECEARSGETAYSIVVSLHDVDPESRVQLEKVVRGEQIGTRVTPLARPAGMEVPEPTLATPAESANEEPGLPPQGPQDRRKHERHHYDRPVEILDFDDTRASQAALGHDLSLEGVRIVEHPELAVGTHVTLALYGGQREEPVLIEAHVVRDEGEAGMALAFESISEAQTRALQKLTSGLRPLESLRDRTRDRDPMVMARISTPTN